MQRETTITKLGEEISYYERLKYRLRLEIECLDLLEVLELKREEFVK